MLLALRNPLRNRRALWGSPGLLACTEQRTERMMVRMKIWESRFVNASKDRKGKEIKYGRTSDIWETQIKSGQLPNLFCNQ